MSFWRRDKAAEEAAGKAIMDALDTTVNGPPGPKPEPTVSVQCGLCRQWMQWDPDKRKARAICHKCGFAVLVVLDAKR